MIRSLVAQVNPRLYARPYPRTSSRTTLAPSDAATSLVRSVELLSTTTTSSTKSGMARRTFSMPCSSFRQGMITVTERDLYIRPALPTFFTGRASGYHEVYEAVCAISLLCGGNCLRLGPGQRKECVPAQDVEGDGPISGEPPHQRARVPNRDRPEAGGCHPHRPDRRGIRGQDGNTLPTARACREARQTGE